MIEAVRRLYKEICSPTYGGGYLWAIIAIGHVMLGAMLQGALGALGVAARLSIGIVYWCVKERRDLKRKGSLKDGLIDSTFVVVGAFYEGPRYWPVIVFTAVCIGAIIRESKVGK